MCSLARKALKLTANLIAKIKKDVCSISTSQVENKCISQI